MNWKVFIRKVVLSLTAIVFVLAAICFFDSLRYPRIVRSAYWRHPLLLVRATAAFICARNGIGREQIRKQASWSGCTEQLRIQLLYLPEAPDDDKTIRDRLFGLIVKISRKTDEELFWLVTPLRNGSEIADERLVFEYRTGRLVCSQELSDFLSQ